MRPGLLLLQIVAIFSLAACGSGEPGKLSAGEVEGPEGEAIVRHLIANLPPLEQAPKEYCVIVGRASTSMKFVGRMSDLKVNFISGEVLRVREPDKAIVDPRNNISPVQLQILEIKRTGEHTCDAIAGWAFKKTFERRRYRLENDGSGWKVTPGERVEGNYEAKK